MRLNEISDKPGARQARTRIGRGIGSGRGKTGGRGVKGQKSRSGVAVKGFEGGQMPIHRRLPKRGFTNPSGKRFAEIGLGRLQAAVDGKLIDPAKPVTEAVLKDSGLVTHLRDGVRVLGTGAITAKLALEVAGASAPAIAAIEAAGGSVKILQPKEDKSGRAPKGKNAARAAAAGEAPAPVGETAGEDKSE